MRPLDVGRDLGGVVTLLEQVFGQGIEAELSEVAHDFCLLHYLSPFLWALEKAFPNLGKLLYGYVWVEEGHIVGNVTITKVGRQRGLWVISNVAVHPNYRRQGIGRAMLEAAIELAKMQGGERVILEVERENLAAQELYRSLGFTKVGGIVHLSLAKIGQVSPISLGADFRWERLEAGEGKEAYALAKAAIPLKMQSLRPIRRGQFQTNLWYRMTNWVGNLTAGRNVHRLGLREGAKLVALLNIYASRSYGGRHQLELFIHPDYEGRVEETLLHKGLEILQRYPQKRVTTSLPLSQSELSKKFGFREMRALEQLEFRLG